MAVYQVVLALEQRIDKLSVLARKHLLPRVGHGIILPEGGEVRAVIPAEGQAHRVLQKLRDIRLDDVIIHVSCIEVHIKVIGILYRAYILPDLRIRFKELLERLEVVDLLVRGYHRVHHVVQYGAGIDGVILVLVFLRLGMHAHERGHHAAHIIAFGLYRDRIA